MRQSKTWTSSLDLGLDSVRKLDSSILGGCEVSIEVVLDSKVTFASP